MLSNFLIIPVVRDEIKVKRAPTIPTGAHRRNNTTTLTEEIIQTPPRAAFKTIKILSM